MIKAIKKLLKGNERLNHFTAWCYRLMHNFGHGSRRVTCGGVYLNRVTFSIAEGSQVVIGNLARLHNCSFCISGRNSKIVIGGGKTVISNTSFCCEDDESVIVIGEDFTMEGGEIAAIEGCRVEMGNDCMLSAGIDIRNGDSHVMLDAESGKRLNESCDIHIGNHVWLTRRVSVLKGARIADGCIIGHSSVVTGDCSEPQSVYAGIPARFVKNGISWSRFRNTNPSKGTP